MPTIQEAVQYSQQVRSLAGTVEMLELQVDQLPPSLGATKFKMQADIKSLNDTIEESVAIANKMKTDCRNPPAPGPAQALFAPTDGG